MRELIEALNKAEKELVIEIQVNVDDVVSELNESQKATLDRVLNKIYGNCQNLLDGVGNGGHAD